MQILTSVVAALLMLAASIHAETGTPTINREAVINSAIVPCVTAPLLFTTSAAKLETLNGTKVFAAGGTGPLTIHVHNNGGVSGLYINWSRNPGSPANLNGVGNGPLGSSTMGVYPTNWAGRIAIGQDKDSSVIQRGSSIEASFVNGVPSLDVSYVEGYTVPITCACQGVTNTGCNTPLFWGSSPCPSPGPSTCYNPLHASQQGPNTPAQAFFEPCQGAAMTYPSDTAGTIRGCGVNEYFCCVGHNCPRNGAQHSKRSLYPRRSAGDPARRAVLHDGEEHE